MYCSYFSVTMADSDKGFDTLFDHMNFQRAKTQYTRPKAWPKSVSEMQHHTDMSNEEVKDVNDDYHKYKMKSGHGQPVAKKSTVMMQSPNVSTAAKTAPLQVKNNSNASAVRWSWRDTSAN